MKILWKHPVYRVLTLIIGCITAVQVWAGDDPILETYLQQVRERHPDLQSMRSMIEAEQHRTNMSAGWMNPMLSLGVMSVPYPSLKTNIEAMTMFQIGIMQRIPFPGKTSQARELGNAKANALTAELYVEERDMEAMVRMAYYDLTAAIAMQGILDSGTVLLQEMKSGATAMNGAGMGSSVDVYTVDAEIVLWEKQIIDNKALIAIRRSTLASLLGKKATDSIPVTPLPIHPSDIPFDHDLTGNPDQAPSLKAAQARLLEAEAGVLVADKTWYPDIDLMLQYGYRRPLHLSSSSVDHTGARITSNEVMKQDDLVSIGITLPVPLFAGSNQNAMKGEMIAMVKSNRNKQAAVKLEWERQVTSEFAELNQKIQSARKLQSRVIPAQEKAWQAALIGYRSGTTTLMAVSEIRMKYLMSKMEERMLTAESYARTGNLLGRVEP